MSKVLSEDGLIKQKKTPSYALLRSLYDREINGMKKPSNIIKTTYLTVHPNCTVLNVEKPPCYLRKFTPTGRQFIAFSQDQTSVEVYDYLGCSKAADLLRNFRENCIGQNNGGDFVRKRIFEKLFARKHVIRVSTRGQQLNRECSLLSTNGALAIVGSASITTVSPPSFHDVFTNNEAVTPNPLFPLENYTIYLLSIHSGRVCHSMEFKYDKIFLSHNQGIYLLRDTLAILSVQHQTIYVYKIVNKKFLLIKKIGRFCHDSERAMLSTPVYSTVCRSRPFNETTINSLKHKFMVFLYKKADSEAKQTSSQYPIRKFYKYFSHFLSLRMWKIQLLSVEHLLIRYASEEVATVRINEPNTQTSFFMIYNFMEAKVLNIYENTSDELLNIYESNCDAFRIPFINPNGYIPCSPSNNIYSRESHQKFKNTILNAKYGGPMEANKRILGHLPVAAQSFNSSPYLNTSLYSYDEKWVSPMERPKVVGEYPIRFYSRESGVLNFCLYTNESRGPPLTDRRRLVAFTFHPTDPFAISVQRDNLEYIVNFHIRKEYLPE